MRFDEPHVLWALLGVLAFGARVARLLARRRQAMAQFAEAGLIDRITERLDARRRTVRLRVRAAALALLVVAAAGPLWGFRWEEVRREGIDLIVALDTSRSMLTPDVAPNRLERAKLAILDLLGRLDGDRVGLVAFAGTAFLECPLTLDYAAFERTLRTTWAGIIPRGGTSLARAIDESLASFEAREGKHQALLLITDGEDHEGDVEAAARRAKEAGVRIFTVGIGTAEGELVPAADARGPRRERSGAQSTPYLKDRSGNVVKSRLDESTLETIARATGGAYVRGLGPALGLDEVFRDHIATMERRDVASRLERRWEQRFQIPLGLAVVLLLIEAGIGDAPLPRKHRRRLPGLGRSAAALLVLASGALSASVAAGAEDPGVEGWLAYEKRDYESAVERWREALIDAPDSPLIRFNLGAALYRAGRFGDAAEAFAKVAAAAHPAWTAKASYNLGNALYRAGEGALASDKQATLQSWERALVAYRGAMAADPADVEPKAAHEIVAKRLDELREELERERDEQAPQQAPEPQPQGSEQPPDPGQGEQGSEPQEAEADPDAAAEGGDAPDDPQGEQQEGDRAEQGGDEDAARENADEQADGRERPDDSGAESAGEREQQAAAAEQSDGGDEGQPMNEDEAAEARAAAEHPGDQAPPPSGEPDGGTAYAGGEAAQDDLRAEAHAVLDAVRREELGPDEIVRGRRAARVAEPMKDW